jgi:SAM-dependent methyltransferase
VSTEPDRLQWDWDVRGYLDEYYGYAEVPPHTHSLLAFLTAQLGRIGRTFERVLELGCGPVVIHAATFAPWARRIDMADLQRGNLDAIDAWVRGDRDAFDWSPYLADVVALDGLGGDVAARAALMRSRIHTRIGDITRELPLGEPARYDLVASFFSLEWVVPTREAWRTHVGRFTDMLEPGGWVLLGALYDTPGLQIAGTTYASARVDEQAMRELLLDLGFAAETVHVQLGAPCIEDGQVQHSDLFACAQKR